MVALHDYLIDGFAGKIEDLEGIIENKIHDLKLEQFNIDRATLQSLKTDVNLNSINLSETGESEETLPVDYEGPQLEIGFNAQYLLDFLRAVTEDNVQFKFRDGQSAGELRQGVDDETYRYVIMPMRI